MILVVFQVVARGTFFSHFRQEPALRLVSLQLKYGPWRDALLEVYKQHSSRCPGVKGLCRQRANFILDLLQEVCLRMDGVKCDAWHRNVSHRLWFTSGPASFLARLRILLPARKLGLQLRFMKNNTIRKRLCHSRAEVAAAVSQLELHIRAADDCAALPAPRTCAEWIESASGCASVLRRQIYRGSRCFATAFVS